MITVTILNRNSEETLPGVLESTASFPEVVLLDTGSTDRSLELAKTFPNVKIFEREFSGFGPLHNEMAALASEDWILSLDSDEVLTPELVEEIHQLRLDPQCVYSFPMHNFFNGKWIRSCGWYPDRHVRLYHRKVTAFTQAEIHEGVITEGLQEQKLRHPVQHYSYRNIGDFLGKMQFYSSLFAKEHQGKKASSLGKAVGHGLFAFFKSYLLKKGFLQGYEGWVISGYNAHTAYYKYLKLYEANQRLK